MCFFRSLFFLRFLLFNIRLSGLSNLLTFYATLKYLCFTYLWMQKMCFFLFSNKNVWSMMLSKGWWDWDWNSFATFFLLLSFVVLCKILYKLWQRTISPFRWPAISNTLLQIISTPYSVMNKFQVSTKFCEEKRKGQHNESSNSNWSILRVPMRKTGNCFEVLKLKFGTAQKILIFRFEYRVFLWWWFCRWNRGTTTKYKSFLLCFR